jgi:hypothetical protein
LFHIAWSSDFASKPAKGSKATAEPGVAEPVMDEDEIL